MADVTFVYHPDFLEHDTGQHPERPERLTAIVDAVRRACLPGLDFVTPSPASMEQVARVHAIRHVERVRRIAASGGGYADLDTVVLPRSYDVALLAAGGAIRAAEAVLSGEARASFAAVRPPGHHAGPSSTGGFCLLNNAAIAARHAQVAFGVSRVLIVDFDAHHGNGTQAVFDEDPSVLYASVHEYPFYPGTGAVREVGRGAGRGYVVNVAVPAGTGDLEYERIFDEALAPVARQFRPELILASAGYDAHWLDPLVLLEVSTAGFASMVGRLREWADELCGGRLALILEGGYDLGALAASVVASLAVLVGVPPTDPFGQPGRRRPVDIAPTIAEVRRAHPWWFGQLKG